MKRKPNWIGYARVSSIDQHLARQLDALHQAGVPSSNIYQEKISGAHANNRPELQHMLHDVNRTNVVAVLAIDRLGRNYKDIKNIMAKIKAKGAKLVILNLPITKKYVQSGSLMSILDEFMIDILAYQADHERKAIRARQAQGIAEAKKRGVYKGREVKFSRDNRELQGAFDDYFNRDKTNLSVGRIASMHGMSRITLYRKLKRYKPKHYEEQFNFQKKQ